MAGGVDDDVYAVMDAGDVVIENADEGFDQILSHVSYTLPANVEALLLDEDAGNINGTGNELPNYIQGSNGNNVLTGWPRQRRARRHGRQGHPDRRPRRRLVLLARRRGDRHHGCDRRRDPGLQPSSRATASTFIHRRRRLRGRRPGLHIHRRRGRSPGRRARSGTTTPAATPTSRCRPARRWTSKA